MRFPNSIGAATRRYSDTPYIQDKFLVRHVVSPTTQISYTYEYRVRQSKN